MSVCWHQYSNGIQMEILKGNVNVNYDAVYENFVAQELISKGYPTYYFNNKKLGELDFVTDNGNGEVVPIEVSPARSNYKSFILRTKNLKSTPQ